ncbi:hypothetical protein N7447_005062 [Penicillium robsamsonii]|uniref:uncharacterized protein n=1 Tax=Penicillium robsamsonii TaxID=1792511 RepID=UPI0025481330|nr:uncharacterized protein N7447_005062 [Penicillium robsamsonii]KAJ5822722.1 hypothetical protein N7447_005062 [Penicillium robsamsonii]
MAPLSKQQPRITLKGLERTPLKPTGVLDAFESFDVTPVIGREFPNASLKDFLSASNSDDLLRELALTISQRGVVFFRKQDGLDDNLQKELVQRLGELSGKPETSGLHIHPVVNSGREHGVTDDEISVSFLRLEVKFLDGLTATYAGPNFNDVAKKNGFEVHPGPRGAPENVGGGGTIRGAPFTGWKSVFAVGNMVQKINGVTDEESDHLLNWFLSLVVENHDLQVRLRWQNPNDLAICDNRSVFHAATSDHEGFGQRTGHRAVGLGERPYLDPNSTSRREALARDP